VGQEDQRNLLGAAPRLVVMLRDFVVIGNDAVLAQKPPAPVSPTCFISLPAFLMI
jgi:hypothetical protein